MVEKRMRNRRDAHAASQGSIAVCEHLRMEGRPEARWALSAHAGWPPWFCCADKIDGPCLGCPDTLYESWPKHGEWDLTIAGKFSPRTPKPVPQPIVPFLPLRRLLLHEFICAHWSLRKSPQEPNVIWVQAIVNFELGTRSLTQPAAAQNIT